MALQLLDSMINDFSGCNRYSSTQIRIKELPGAEIPSIDKHFEFVGNVCLPKLGSHELLIETEYLSVDPYMRGAMNTWYNTSSKQMNGYQIAKVIESNDDKYKPNDYVYGHWPWSTRNVIHCKTIQSIIPPKISITEDDEKSKVDITCIPHSYYIGSVGMPGMTAYYGLIYKGEIKKGENVLISGAAGAVGSICGQIAKQIYGCNVVGICGKKEKINWLKNELLFDGAINYKEYGNNFNKIQERLSQEFPNGIDIYFDNVGGPFTSAVWDILNPKSRVIICGQIAHYNTDNTVPSLRPMLHKLIYKEIQIKGIIVTNFKDKQKFYNDMIKWISTKKIKVKQTVINGFKNAPKAFIGLFHGENIGKMVVKCT